MTKIAHWNSPVLVHDHLAMSLTDRMRQVQAARGTEGKPLSGNAWSVKAGVSKSMVNHILNGTIRSPTSALLIKLARAAKVSEGWLITGEGQMDGPVPSDFDVYPARQRVVEMLTVDGTAPPRVIARLRAVDIYTNDPGIREWLRLALRFLEDEERASDNVRPASNA